MKRFLWLLAACSSGSKATPPPPPPADAAPPPLDAQPTTASLAGWVVGPDGQRVPHATVRMEHDDGVHTSPAYTTQTDDTGHYHFDDFTIANDLQIGAFTDDASPRSSDFFVLIDPGEHKTLDLPLDRASTVRGTVVGAKGPVPITVDDGRVVTSAADGRFVIGGLGGGDHVLTVAGAKPVTVHFDDAHGEAKVTITPVR